MSREKLLQANINKLLYEKNEARKTIDYLNKKVADLEKHLSKMNVLRRIISPMGTMDGIEFLISKIKDTKNNSDFFNSMNKSN